MGAGEFGAFMRLGAAAKDGPGWRERARLAKRVEGDEVRGAVFFSSIVV